MLNAASKVDLICLVSVNGFLREVWSVADRISHSLSPRPYFWWNYATNPEGVNFLAPVIINFRLKFSVSCRLVSGFFLVQG